MSVAPRWKRRADEIAEAIGDELSINGTVSIGNDVSLSVATISALAKAITDVLNPNAISRAIWTDEAPGTHVATVVSPVAGESLQHWLITLNGTSVIRVFQLWAYDNSYQIAATEYSLGTAFGVVPNASPPYRNEFRLPSSNINNVTVVSTSTTPVHVQVRNVAGGFTAMGSDISTSLKSSPQPVSIADTVDVKTATGEAVAITGTVNANVGSVTLPISNPNNITVPVVNSGNITIPVNVGTSTVPVRASANGTPQNSSGVNVLVSVNPTHSVTVPVSVGSAAVPVSVPSGLTVPASVASNLTVPVAVGGATVPAYVPSNVTVPASVSSGLTVPVSVGSNTVPVAVGSVTVPVANTNSVIVPVENTNNVTVPVTSGGVVDVNIKTVETNARDQFHIAMETALNDANDIDVIPVDATLRGYVNWVHSYSTTDYFKWTIVVASGYTHYNQSLRDGTIPQYASPTTLALYAHREVYRKSGSNDWHIITDEEPSSPTLTAQQIADAIALTTTSTIRGTVTEIHVSSVDPWWKVTLLSKSVPEPTIYGNPPSGVFIGLNVVKNTSGNWIPSYQYD